MVSMPYMFQKGRDWQLLEWWLSHNADGGRVDRKVAMLDRIRADSKAVKPPGANPPPVPTDHPPNTGALDGHIQRDWFGIEPMNEEDPPQPIPHPHNGATSNGGGPSRPHIGWWQNWYGTPSGIFGEALARAIEVSLGLEHGNPVPRKANGDVRKRDLGRDWPIEFVWICPVGWFQAGITWRHLEGWRLPGTLDRQGLVTVTWLTPGNSLPYNAAVGDAHGLFHTLDAPQRADNIPGEPHLNMEADPQSSDARRGHWIVGHRITEVVLYQGPNPKAQGQWDPVIPGTRSTADPVDVMTVRPAWRDGGVHPGDPNAANDWNYY